MQEQTVSAHHEPPQLGRETCCMVRGQVTGPVELVQIAPDVWSLFTIHGPGNSRFAPKIPNRLLVYRVVDANGAASLVIVNAIWPDEEKGEPFNALRELSRELDAPIRFIINPGPEHHLSLGAYAKAFPDARVCVAAGRIERENPELCAIDNVETMKVGDALPELSQQGFHVHVWDGFMEGSTPNKLQFRFGAKRGTAEPTVFWHEASGTFLNGGHGWWYWDDNDVKPGWLIRKLLRPQKGKIVWSPIHYAVHDTDRCVDSARRILDWRFHTLLDLHASPDIRLEKRAHELVSQTMLPLLERDWDALPFGSDSLEIPEGMVTGGDWKTYRDINPA